MSIVSVQGDKWEETNALLMKTLALDPKERHLYLENQPVSVEIREEVISLLSFEQDADEILQTSAIEFSRDFFDDDPDAPCTWLARRSGFTALFQN